MQTEAVWYLMPSSQTPLISAQVAVWVSRVWSHLARMSFSSMMILLLYMIQLCPWSRMTRCSRMPRI